MCLYWLVGLYWRLYTLALSLELVLEFLVHLIASLYTLAVVQVMESTGRELRSLASLHLPCPSSSSSLVYACIGCPRTCKVVPAQSVYDITEASRYPAAFRALEV
jgi:hypothetical protein